MFKRVDKRRKRQEEEEELGLDEDMKEVLGLNDTDSDESDSDDDSESGSEAADDADEVEGEERDEDDEDSSDEEDEEEPPISVEEALRDPVYVVSIEPDVKACITCPGKLLKNAEILRLHRASKAHERRWRQFCDFAKSSNAPPSSNAWDVLKQRAEEQPKLSLTEGSAVSKRNQKREEQKAKNVARREKKREANAKRKAKKAAALASGADSSGSPQKDASAPKNTDSPASARPTKKRKVAPAPAPPSDDDDDDDAAEAALPTPPPKAKTGRSPRRERLERQGKLQEKFHGHEPPGGRGKGNGKKWAPGERGKQQKKDGRGGGKSKVDRQKPLQIFD